MHEDMTSGNDTRPSDGFVDWYEDYLFKWKKFHCYWLTEYEGKLKVYFYRGLVDDISLFKEIAAFFGFDVMKSAERKRRSDCFLAHGEKMAEKLRPPVPLIENAKVVLKDHYAEKTREAIAYLEKLLQDKYNRKFTIIS
ncbi:uncharacterized protein [Watersipora subatra]|uniref:uncharacterized protein n=1 Tax=Watersipora subatra TaxID=2589382 RepID=UPI00355BB81B